MILVHKCDFIYLIRGNCTTTPTSTPFSLSSSFFSLSLSPHPPLVTSRSYTAPSPPFPLSPLSLPSPPCSAVHHPCCFSSSQINMKVAAVLLLLGLVAHGQRQLLRSLLPVLPESRRRDNCPSWRRTWRWWLRRLRRCRRRFWRIRRPRRLRLWRLRRCGRSGRLRLWWRLRRFWAASEASAAFGGFGHGGHGRYYREYCELNECHATPLLVAVG